MQILGNLKIKNSCRNTFKILDTLTIPFDFETCLLKNVKCNNNIKTKIFLHSALEIQKSVEQNNIV